jgi:hypothetical protein
VRREGFYIRGESSRRSRSTHFDVIPSPVLSLSKGGATPAPPGTARHNCPTGRAGVRRTAGAVQVGIPEARLGSAPAVRKGEDHGDSSAP